VTQPQPVPGAAAGDPPGPDDVAATVVHPPEAADHGTSAPGRAPASPDRPPVTPDRAPAGRPGPVQSADDTPAVSDTPGVGDVAPPSGTAAPATTADGTPAPATTADGTAAPATVSAGTASPVTAASGTASAGTPPPATTADGTPVAGTASPGTAASGGAPVASAAGGGGNGAVGAAPATISASTTPAQDATLLERALFEVKRVIVGQDRMIERMLVALLARGHCLLEGVPGVAKTLAVETLARVVGGTFARIQFTPDLVPADIVGTRIYRASSESFAVELGPVFTNFLLADEVNRAPAKVQSALLEVMAEQHVSIGGQTFAVPMPFLVMATQNPIEQEGVYPLPEAQRDRFLLKIVVGYPTDVEEREIVYRVGVRIPTPNAVLDPEQLMRLQGKADAVFVHNALVDYAVRLVFATREPARYGVPDVAQLIQYGASPRASLGIVRAARALALMRGRDYALPQDLIDIAPDVLRHRLVLSYDALADDIPADHIVDRVLQAVPPPAVTPRQDAAPPAGDFAVAPGGRPGRGHGAPPPGLPAWPGR
jgi:MoxR-like ATPase